MEDDNKKWLYKNCSAFINSKFNDVVLFNKAGLIREAALKRGICGDEVSACYREINLRKANEKIT